MKSGETAPIIVKKKKVVAGDGHHGGAWKVAYADFVTAMMAFFMLMWLLNATTEKQRKGLADYFSPTIAVNRVSGGGDGNFGGQTVFSENVLPRMGQGATSLNPTEQNAARGAINASPDSGGQQDLADRASELLGSGGQSLLEINETPHVELRLTDEGLSVELFARPGAPLFSGSATPTPLLRALMAAVAGLAHETSSRIAVAAHTRATPVVLAHDPLWDDSARRADAVRDLLQRNGIDGRRIARSTAHADRRLATSNPMAVRNNRVEIIFLRE